MVAPQPLQGAPRCGIFEMAMTIQPFRATKRLRAFSAQNHPDCFHQDMEVHPQRPVADGIFIHS